MYTSNQSLSGDQRIPAIVANGALYKCCHNYNEIAFDKKYMKLALFPFFVIFLTSCIVKYSLGMELYKSAISFSKFLHQQVMKDICRKKLK